MGYLNGKDRLRLFFFYLGSRAPAYWKLIWWTWTSGNELLVVSLHIWTINFWTQSTEHFNQLLGICLEVTGSIPLKLINDNLFIIYLDMFELCCIEYWRFSLTKKW